MQNLHSIDARHFEGLEERLRTVLREAPLMPNLERYQQEVVGRFIPQHQRVRLANMDALRWYDFRDPLYERPNFNYREIDTAAVAARLDRQVDMLGMAMFPIADFGLRISNDEVRALTYVGFMREGEELRYRGVRLFVDG